MAAILTIGEPALQQPSRPVIWPDPALADEVEQLGATLETFRREHGFGRAISAPQIGIAKRFIYVNLGATPFVVVSTGDRYAIGR